MKKVFVLVMAIAIIAGVLGYLKDSKEIKEREEAEAKISAKVEPVKYSDEDARMILKMHESGDHTLCEDTQIEYDSENRRYAATCIVADRYIATVYTYVDPDLYN